MNADLSSSTSHGDGASDGNSPPVQTTWFPDYVRLIEENQEQEKLKSGFRPNLVSECLICYKALDISITYPRESDAQSQLNEGQFEQTRLLVCGHLMGKDCMQQLVSTSRLCPLCRKYNGCERCKFILLSDYPDGSYGLTEGVPLTAARYQDAILEKLYCPTCFAEQILDIIGTIVANNEDCPLCKERNPYHIGEMETVDEHQGRRERAADDFLRERLKAIAKLMLQSTGNISAGARWDKEAFERETLRVTEEFILVVPPDFRRSIFSNCSYTSETAI